MYLFHSLWKKTFETVLSSQGLKGQKGPIVSKGRSPLTPLGIHTPSWKASTTFTCQSICNFCSHPHPANYMNPQNKGSWSLAFATPTLATQAFGHPYFHRSYPALLWAYAFHPPTPTLVRPLLFHEKRLPINPACMLIDSLIYST